MLHRSEALAAVMVSLRWLLLPVLTVKSTTSSMISVMFDQVDRRLRWVL